MALIWLGKPCISRSVLTLKCITILSLHIHIHKHYTVFNILSKTSSPSLSYFSSKKRWKPKIFSDIWTYIIWETFCISPYLFPIFSIITVTQCVALMGSIIENIERKRCHQYIPHIELLYSILHSSWGIRFPMVRCHWVDIFKVFFIFINFNEIS